MSRPIATDQLHYRRSARTDLRVWGMLLIGGAFVIVGYVVDPQQNCNSSGECAPWLVPLAWVLGIVVTVAAVGLLWSNPRRGSRIDPQTGDLIWWKNRTTRHAGDCGRIHPSRVARIYVDSGSDSDHVSLYDLDGVRQAYFDEEVIPWPYDRWAGRLRDIWPHIVIDCGNG